MKTKRIAYLFIALLLVCGMAACNEASTSETSSPATQTAQKTAAAATATPEPESEIPSYMNMDSEFPIVKEGEEVTLSVTVSQDDTYGGDAEDIWFWKFVEERMNIQLEIEQILGSALTERKQLLFASTELPDMLINMGLSTTELVTYGQNEHQLLALNDYLTEDYAPAMTMWLEALSDMQAVCTCPDGNMYTLPQISAVGGGGSCARLFINQTWLDAVGMDTPETLDDFTAMLRAFKQQDPGGVGSDNVIPMGGGFNAIDPSYYILNALGFLTYDGTGVSAALRGGEVVIPAGDEVYEEFLTIMNTYYDEGLISEDFFTLDGTQVRAQAVEGLLGVLGEPAYLALPEAEQFQQWWAVKPLTSQWNGTQQWPQYSRYGIGGFAVSAATEYPEVCVRFADYSYTDQGAKYVWVGPMVGEDTLDFVGGWYVNDEGNYKQVDVENGKYENNYFLYLGEITGTGGSFGNMTESSFAHQEDKWSLIHELAGVEGVVKTYDAANGDDHYRMSVMENLEPYMVESYPAYTYFTEEQNTRISDLKTVIQNYVESETAKFITGARPLDEFDGYLSELETLGIAEYRQYYADAYASYLANN